MSGGHPVSTDRSGAENLSLGESNPSAPENKNALTEVRAFSFSCGWWDLNPHDRETGRF